MSNIPILCFEEVKRWQPIQYADLTVIYVNTKRRTDAKGAGRMRGKYSGANVIYINAVIQRAKSYFIPLSIAGYVSTFPVLCLKNGLQVKVLNGLIILES